MQKLMMTANITLHAIQEAQKHKGKKDINILYSCHKGDVMATFVYRPREEIKGRKIEFETIDETARLK
jgi:hypothetical protein